MPRASSPRLLPRLLLVALISGTSLAAAPQAPPTPLETAHSDEPSPPVEVPGSKKPYENQSLYERYLPGSPPHSPETRGNRWNDPANLRHSASLRGPVGLLHVESADFGRPWLLRFGLGIEHFNVANFPEAGAAATRTGGTFAVSYLPLDFFELSLAYHDAANTNSSSTPTLIQTQGDIGLSARMGAEWLRGLYAGVGLELRGLSGPLSQEARLYAFGSRPYAFGTYEVPAALGQMPLRIHLNLSHESDESSRFSQGQRLGTAEQYALRIHRYPRLSGALGLESALAWVTVFAEYLVSVPLGVEGGTLETPDGRRVGVGSALPQLVDVGIKVTALENLTFVGALEWGLFRRVVHDVPATPPFSLLVGASYAVDPFHRYGLRYVQRNTEKAVERAPRPRTGEIEGLVLDAATRRPLPFAIVELGPGLPPVATDAERGQFLTQQVPAGQHRLTFRKDGYEEASLAVTVLPGKREQTHVELKPMVRRAKVLVKVVSNGKAIDAEAHFSGQQEQILPLKKDAPGATPLEVDPGLYVIDVTSKGYLSQTRQIQLPPGSEMPVNFELVPEPKKSLVVVTEQKIEILQKIHFAFGKATIQPDSFALLNEVVSAIVTHRLPRLRIEGHTDNRGGDDFNRRLSDDRAKAVAAYLSSQGIAAERLTAVGYGATRPVAPNLTAAGRERNRRVEFMIER